MIRIQPYNERDRVMSKNTKVKGMLYLQIKKPKGSKYQFDQSLLCPRLHPLLF